MSRRGTFRFYAELNDFLPAPKRYLQFEHVFSGSPAVKDVIEALGVPHAEVDLILVNGQSQSFGYRLMDGDRVSVYPVFEGLDIGGITRVRPAALREPRFLLDVHLGRLARWLRLLGFDSAYASEAEDEALARRAAREGRILLTRDRQLLKRRLVTHGYCIRSQAPIEQAVEVVRRFDLSAQAAPLTRCLRCNGRLAPVSPEEAGARLPESLRGGTVQVIECLGCRQVYWRGSHTPRLEGLAHSLLARSPSSDETPFPPAPLGST